MKSFLAKTLLLFVFLFPLIAIGQTSMYISHATLSGNIKQDTLVDASTGIKVLLDKKRIYITAIDSKGKQLWKTDPYIDNKLMEYRVRRPMIVYFKLDKERTGKRNVVSIGYNNTQFGFLDVKTGRFTYRGQD